MSPKDPGYGRYKKGSGCRSTPQTMALGGGETLERKGKKPIGRTTSVAIFTEKRSSGRTLFPYCLPMSGGERKLAGGANFCPSAEAKNVFRFPLRTGKGGGG